MLELLALKVVLPEKVIFSTFLLESDGVGVEGVEGVEGVLGVDGVDGVPGVEGVAGESYRGSSSLSASDKVSTSSVDSVGLDGLLTMPITQLVMAKARAQITRPMRA